MNQSMDISAMSSTEEGQINGAVPFKAIAIPQLSTASASLLASMTMAIMIVRTERGPGIIPIPSTPYRRIIFGLSLSDIFQSFAFLLGPFAVPTHIPGALWSIGNDGTCQAAGFMLSIGLSSVYMYECFICFYYLCKLRYRMTNEAFRRCYEWKIHAFIISSSVLFAGIGLYLDLVHTRGRTFCTFAPKPFGCRIQPELVGECDPVTTERLNKYGRIGSSGFVLILFGICAMMSLLYYHVVTFDRAHPPMPAHEDSPPESEGGVDDVDADDQNSVIENQDQAQGQEREQDEGHNQAMRSSRERLNELSAVYRREMLIQASCYVGAFFLIYIPPTAAALVEKRDGQYPSAFFQVLPFVFYPLGGVLNILVYTRPQAASVRRNHPDASWLQCFWRVLKAGGDLPPTSAGEDDDDPSDADFVPPRTPRTPAQQQQPQLPQSQPQQLRNNDNISSLGLSSQGLPQGEEEEIRSSTNDDVIDLRNLIDNSRSLPSQLGLGSYADTASEAGADADAANNSQDASGSARTRRRRGVDEEGEETDRAGDTNTNSRDSSLLLSLPQDLGSIETPPPVFSQVLLSHLSTNNSGSNGSSDEDGTRTGAGGTRSGERQRGRNDPDQSGEDDDEEQEGDENAGAGENADDSSEVEVPEFVALNMSSMDVSSFGSYVNLRKTSRWGMRRR